jgi:XTP/dITP diphosphohydrolase
MIRRFEEKKLVIATHNVGKLREMQELLQPFGIEALSAARLNLSEPAETGFMFAENAAIKAHAAAKASGIPALADDSGLCIDALDGAPGIFTANWAGPNKNFITAFTRIEQELVLRGALSLQQRRAHFTAALVLAWPDGEQALFEGRVLGHLVLPGRGTQGFGYDPIFQPDGFDRTFGEMSAEEKHGLDPSGTRKPLSHRARAFQNLAKSLFSA